MAVLKSEGCFRPDSQAYVGVEAVTNLREAFRTVGYALDPDGTLRPMSLENLDVPDMHEALKGYIRRAQVGIADAALVVGTGKDLLEATARLVLLETTGAYPQHSNFPTTLVSVHGGYPGPVESLSPYQLY